MPLDTKVEAQGFLFTWYNMHTKLWNVCHSENPMISIILPKSSWPCFSTDTLLSFGSFTWHLVHQLHLFSDSQCRAQTKTSKGWGSPHQGIVPSQGNNSTSISTKIQRGCLCYTFFSCLFSLFSFVPWYQGPILKLFEFFSLFSLCVPPYPDLQNYGKSSCQLIFLAIIFLSVPTLEIFL